jgi:hypothetical protein
MPFAKDAKATPTYFRARSGALCAYLTIDVRPSIRRKRMDIMTVLGQLGLGLATNAIYDLIKGCAGKEVSVKDVEAAIQNQINMHGISMSAETVIRALSEKGFISIKGSHLHANESIIFGSVVGGASMGNNSKLTTNKTAIHASDNASMNTVGNAQVRQNPDGSISFHTGEGGSIDFRT